ncbi:M14 metallopeptidase family protein [Rapidithrix thailandica]|uniref:M14 metallopeptidase family protein n=1 Tax=Rapidithrix thailandica TaxID=413964 RepID=A0AAW9SB57_9BACT
MNKYLLLLYFLCSVLFSYAQALQSPSAFLHYPLGQQFTFHHQVIDYFEHIDALSPRVKVVRYGETYEGRPLLLAFISSPENLQNLEQIRLKHLSKIKLSHEAAVAKEIPIVWLSYNIHGNEAAGTEAAMKVLYSLATGENQDIATWLDNTLVVVDPCENPDGRERYVNWYRQTSHTHPNPEISASEHWEPWPTGRFNHYLFDLNRDWLWQTQQESACRTKIYQQWMPHVHVDLHEMSSGNSYFFGPAAAPLHPAISQWQKEFQQHVAQNHSKYFDQNNWLYFSKEVFDLFYPSYGDTWPTFQGAVGFTYEQSGHGKAGRILQDAQTGIPLTLADRMLHHYEASLSTIESAYLHREQLLQEFEKYFQTQPTPTTYVIKNTNPEGRIKDFLTLLDKQGIRYGHPQGNSHIKNLRGFHYKTNTTKNLSLDPKDIVISTLQPKAQLLQVVMDPHPELEDSLTYDLTSWALPYVYNLDAYQLKGEKAFVPKEGSLPPFTENKGIEENSYAYIVHWDALGSVHFLAAVLQQTINVRFAMEPFSINGIEYQRGSLVITQADNGHLEEPLGKVVREAADQSKVQLHSTSTGFMHSGKDLGSGYMTYISKPSIALISGPEVSPTAFGELWHYFEQDLQFPVTNLRTDYLEKVDLSKFNVLILPSGDYQEYRELLLDFTSKGGRLIVLEKAIQSTLTSKTKLFQRMEADQASDNKTQPSNDQLLKKYGNTQREGISSSVPGSIYKVYLDETHPLSFGEGSYTFSMKRNAKAYPYLSSGGWNVGVIKEAEPVSGFTGHKVKQQLKASLVIGTESYGSGQLVYFADSPVFRGFWYSGKILLANAVFFNW